LQGKSKKTFNNFSVVREEHTYIIFPEKGFVNITGVRRFSELVSIIPKFCAAFGLAQTDVASDVIVDNISASGDFYSRVNLSRLQQLLNRRGGEEYFTVQFDRNFFPGAFCKTRGFGTLTLFPSGKFVVVGAKCLEHLEKTFQEMRAVMTILLSPQKMSVCAHSVV
jgi:TATA-box binding protein (TBP) (component of TFIID and TFIIIB)